MDALIRLGANLFVVLVQSIFRAIASGGWKRNWKGVAESLGYTSKGLSMAGTIDPALSLNVDTTTASGGVGSRMMTRIQFRGDAVPAELTIGPEGFFSRQFKSEDIQIGHKRTDDALRVVGDEALALAVMDQPARKVLMRGVKKQGSNIDKGVVTIIHAGVLLGRKLRTAIDEAIVFAEHVRVDRLPIPDKLAQNVQTDPVVGVRRRNLVVLQRRFPETTAAIDASLSVLGDDDVDLKVLGATFVADEATLEGLVGQLASVGGAAAARLARRLEEWPAPRREAMLIELLDHKRDSVKTRAAKTLGAVGTVDAVASLREYDGKWLGGPLKQAANDAIDAIQARVGGAPGGLSLIPVAADQGALSLANEASAGG